jgi:drug/metabolite transporter (DMT)-like permease
MWFAGFGLAAVDVIIGICVLPYISLVLLSTSEGTGIVSGILLSYFWLGEDWKTQYFVGILLIIVGCCSLAIVTAVEQEKLTFDKALQEVLSV